MKRSIVVAAVAVVLMPALAQAGSRTESYGIWCGLKAADLASTEYALGRGAVESNSLMKDRGIRIGAGVGTCVAVAEVDHRLRERKKLRWGFRIAAAVGYGLVVRHNMTRGAR